MKPMEGLEATLMGYEKEFGEINGLENLSEKAERLEKLLEKYRRDDRVLSARNTYTMGSPHMYNVIGLQRLFELEEKIHNGIWDAEHPEDYNNLSEKEQKEYTIDKINRLNKLLLKDSPFWRAIVEANTAKMSYISPEDLKKRICSSALA
jgi:hypothetical protein